MTVVITIDPNVRVNGNRTYAGIEDIEGGPVNVGDRVRVWEPESDVSGFATVDRVDEERGLVYLDVNWSALRAPATMSRPATGSAGGRGIVSSSWEIGLMNAACEGDAAPGRPPSTGAVGRLTIS